MESPKPVAQRWVSVKWTAEYLGVTIHTIRRWIRIGALPASRIGRDWRIDATAVEQMMTPTPAPIDQQPAYRAGQGVQLALASGLTPIGERGI